MVHDFNKNPITYLYELMSQSDIWFYESSKIAKYDYNIIKNLKFNILFS